jgi:hypothetical protein
MIGIDWIVVCDLASLIVGVILGVSLMKPGHYSGSRHRGTGYD